MQTLQYFRETPAGLTANEILSAVKRGGLESWRPACEARQQVMQNKPNSLTEQHLAVILTVMGSKQWTVIGLAEATDETEAATRKRLYKLMALRKVSRSTKGQPYVYFRINE